MSISPEWLSQRLRCTKEIVSVDVESMSSAGGLNCLMARLTVAYADKTTGTMVLKRVAEKGEETSRGLGLAREALFYHNFQSHPRLKEILPEVLHAAGDMVSGYKEILMEDLKEGIQSGYFFGSGSPLNWGKDLPAVTRGLNAALSPVFVAKLAARAAARLHATFWKDATLAGDWIRGIGWIRERETSTSAGYVASATPTSGEKGGEDVWEAYQKQCRDQWESLDFSSISWDPFLRACIDASIKRAKPSGFEAFRQWMLKEAPWSLVHGDFHPANCMLVENDGVEQDAELDINGRGDRFRLILLDWENVGIGSGPQEMGQYMISHMDPTLRAKVEREVVEVYYKSLVSANARIAEEMTLEQCWKEYIIGGAGKWVWFMPLLASSCPPKMTQYFHDQLLAFLKTHGLTPETMPMPRT